jgi:hypothetical protein
MRFIRERLLPAAQILSQRGYIIITNLYNGQYRVETTSLARATSSDLKGWRRYPDLYRFEKRAG